MLLAIVAAIVLVGGPGAEPEAASAFKSRANIIVLLTDDQETASLRIMKTVNKEMKRKGVTMKRFYDNFPLCCPSRTTLLTGQYAHNHNVLSNTAPDGGYGVFNELHGENNLALWLQAAGYRTGYIGKFLNEYAEPDEYGTLPVDVPRGWDDWRVLAPSRAQYFGYTLNQNGSLTEFSEAEKDYSTDIFTTKAKRFIRQSSRAPNPFFLTLGYAAPHGGGGGEPGRSCNRAAVPAPRHLGTLKDELKGNLPTSFNEADVSDKPSPVAERAPLTPGQISDILRKRRCAWESLLAVDESVGAILNELKRDKLRNDTYVFFVSDNGLLRGEHRIRSDKRFLYEESSRVPFIARGPQLPRGEQSSDVVANADIAATVLEISGAAAGLTQDGQSLLPSLENPDFERGRAVLFEAFAGEEILGSAHLEVRLQRVGDRFPAGARARALRHRRRPLPAHQPGERSLIQRRRRRPLGPARRPARLRRRRMHVGADRLDRDRRWGRRQGRLPLGAGDRFVDEPAAGQDRCGLVQGQQHLRRRGHRGAV